jgi:hypothetical protein
MVQISGFIANCMRILSYVFVYSNSHLISECKHGMPFRLFRAGSLHPSFHWFRQCPEIREFRRDSQRHSDRRNEDILMKVVVY